MTWIWCGATSRKRCCLAINPPVGAGYRTEACRLPDARGFPGAVRAGVHAPCAVGLPGIVGRRAAARGVPGASPHEPDERRAATRGAARYRDWRDFRRAVGVGDG